MRFSALLLPLLLTACFEIDIKQTDFDEEVDTEENENEDEPVDVVDEDDDAAEDEVDVDDDIDEDEDVVPEFDCATHTIPALGVEKDFSHIGSLDTFAFDGDGYLVTVDDSEMRRHTSTDLVETIALTQGFSRAQFMDFDDAGNAYVVEYSSLFLIEPSGLVTEIYDNLDGSYASEVKVHENGFVYLSNDDELLRYDPSTGILDSHHVEYWHDFYQQIVNAPTMHGFAFAPDGSIHLSILDGNILRIEMNADGSFGDAEHLVTWAAENGVWGSSEQFALEFDVCGNMVVMDDIHQLVQLSEDNFDGTTLDRHHHYTGEEGHFGSGEHGFSATDFFFTAQQDGLSGWGMNSRDVGAPGLRKFQGTVLNQP